MKNSIALLILFFIVVANVVNAQLCTTDNRFTEQEFFTDNQIASRLNVKYATAVDWQGNSVDLKMDVYFPKPFFDPLAKRPFIMMIHGGGFLSGSKENMTNYCREFAKRGFVAVAINYRLGWDTRNKSDQILATYRAQQDAHAALRFVVKNANKAKVDTDWLFIGGSSAGAITSLNTIYLTEDEWEAEVPGITALLGPLDASGNNLNTTFALQGIFNNWGMTLDSGIDPAELLPSIAFHGVLDTTTPIGTGSTFPGSPVFSGSGAIHNYLLANGVCSELTVDSLGFHGIYPGNAGQDFRVNRAACFFKSLFCDNCTSNYFVDAVAPACALSSPAGLDMDIGSGASSVAFNVYPNPIKDVLSIRGDLANYQIELINAAGQVVRRVNYGGTNIAMDVADLVSGLYMLRAIDPTDNSTQIKKILIH